MKQIIMGTAGHIDHGKTSLIKAVTGTNTDRLKEEKLRGITIELGFASLDLPSGRHLGIVDVPGHEKFVKNMVAGATGIDIVVMVIAADEGVMPQTREHMEICSLLGIQHGMVALTKTDMVDEEWMELVMDDITGFTSDTFLEDAPIVPVSSAKGTGIDDFVSTLDTLCKDIPDRMVSGLFRLPVDRVFSMKGFGTVITGTLMSGKVSVGDKVMLYPSGITSKVRGVQVHSLSVEAAEAGMRTAVNFQGLDKDAVNRGQVLAKEGTLFSSYMVDVHLTYLKSNKKPVKTRARVRFHAGTAEVMGLLVLLDREELLPGDSCTAQIRLDEPVATIRDDRFVIRSYSPVRTIGGGMVINPIPVKHKRFRQDVINGLNQIVEADPDDVIAYHVNAAGYKGVMFSHLLIMTHLPEKKLAARIQTLLSKNQLVLADKDRRVYIHNDVFEHLKTQIRNSLDAYHKANPLKPGMVKEELKTKFHQFSDTRLLTLVLNRMIKENTIVMEEDLIRMSGHKVALQVDQKKVRNDMVHIYQKSGLTPPYFRDVVKKLDVDPKQGLQVMMLLVDEGVIVKTKDDLYFHTDAMEKLKATLVDYLKKNEEITTPAFKDMTGASRKYVIPLIEYFDAINLTLRVGDVRQLRRKS